MSQKLEDEIADLKDRLQALQQALVGEVTPFIVGLSPQQNLMFGLLLRRDLCSKQQLYDVLYASRPYADDMPDIKIIDVNVSHMRHKLDEIGIRIETIWGHGYRLTPEMKDKVRALPPATRVAKRETLPPRPRKPRYYQPSKLDAVVAEPRPPPDYAAGPWPPEPEPEIVIPRLRQRRPS